MKKPVPGMLVSLPTTRAVRRGRSEATSSESKASNTYNEVQKLDQLHVVHLSPAEREDQCSGFGRFRFVEP